MITGVHTMFYSSQPDELRAFLRDKLGFSFTDVGEGWLIFDLPDAEMGCHPADIQDGAHSGTHNISFYCDDIERTVSDLKERGVEFTTGVEDMDMGYGLVTHFRLPGDFTVQLYQPRYRRNPRPATDLSPGRKAVRTRKPRQAGRKAARTKPRRKVAAKAALTRKRRAARR